MCNWGLTEEQSSAVHIQTLVSADGFLLGIGFKFQLLFINLASVSGRQLVNSPTAQSLDHWLQGLTNNLTLMKYLKLIFAMGLLSTLFGCGQDNNKKQHTSDLILEEITSRTDTSEGFSDIFLKITSDLKSDTAHIYIAKGLYKNKTVGLQFIVKSNMPNGITAEGEMNSKDGFIRNAIKIISIGQESDELVKALSELYEIPNKNLFTKTTLVTTAFSLNQTIADLNKPGYYKFKLFFNEDSDEVSYAELFFNINTNEKTIELHEKDNDYRKPLVKVFTE